MKPRSLFAIALLIVSFAFASCVDTGFQIRSGQTVCIVAPDGQKPVLYTAIEMFTGDVQRVLASDVHVSDTADADEPTIVLTLNDSLGYESFHLYVDADHRLQIEGGDAHGLAYGLLEVSRRLGVSPWEWWADAAPAERARFSLPAGLDERQSPSVRLRGIFINDEDWGMMPWASRTYEAEAGAGVIGPRTNSRIFELLLRLRANYFWPAMHGCTRPFFLTEGNREAAARYGIYVGGSHCEPMACNANGEWKVRGDGDYNYVTNRDSVLSFWRARVADVADQEIVYTLGMRGVHDGPMEGAKTVDEQREVLTRVINDQRDMLRELVSEDLTQVPQVLVPYKEVLEVYNNGLCVPDDVTLMWCDDNYGYIRHFPTAAEQARSGGNGIYYHVSYWGRPHDYCWLGTQSPALLYQQMSLAYERGIRQMWVLNVGDLKPAEYQTELFLDMAWDIESVQHSGLASHMQAFLAREFGKKAGRLLQPVMQEYYRLSAVRRPEFLAGTRTEEADRAAWSTVHDLPWSEAYIDSRLSDWAHVAGEVARIGHMVDKTNAHRAATYYQLVAYPVWASEQANAKFLYAQKARLHPDRADSEYWPQSDAAYGSIAVLTRTYNEGLDGQGKWRHMMTDAPRNLTAFQRVDRTAALPSTESRVYDHTECLSIDVTASRTGTYALQPGLGHSGHAIYVDRTTDGGDDEPLTYTFRSEQLVRPEADSLTVEVLLIPNHPVDGAALAFSLQLDDQPAVTADYQTHGRSEEWKQNILRGQALRRFAFANDHADAHTLRFRALTDGVLLDQIILTHP